MKGRCIALVMHHLVNYVTYAAKEMVIKQGRVDIIGKGQYLIRLR